MTTLVIAYECDPYRGSEAGAAWGLVQAINSFGDAFVVVGPDSAAGLRRFSTANPDSTLRYTVAPEPWWGQWAKWHRIPRFMAYLSWQRRAARVARAAMSEQEIDLVHHVSVSAYWLPSLATKLGLPYILGPVGGAVTSPRSLWSVLGVSGVAGEILDLVSVRMAAVLPASRRTVARARLVIAQNTETLRRVSRVADDALVLNHGRFIRTGAPSSDPREDFFLWAGRLERRKAPRLAIEALAHAPRARLVIAGDGPQKGQLKRIAKRLDVSDRLELRGEISRSETLHLMDRARAVIFTGLREEGGIALAEALDRGAPVIVLDNGGARTLCANAQQQEPVSLIRPRSLLETARAIGAAMTAVANRSQSHSGSLLDRDGARDALAAIYASALETTAEPGDSNVPGRPSA